MYLIYLPYSSSKAKKASKSFQTERGRLLPLHRLIALNYKETQITSIHLMGKKIYIYNTHSL